MNDLVQRLSEGSHPIVVGGPKASCEDFHQRLTAMGYVFIKFTDTQGGTDLGMRVDTSATDMREADFAAQSGSVHVEGLLTLNYESVRCVADVDLATLSGTGRLVPQA